MYAKRARSSAEERAAHNRLAPGSIPGEPTTNLFKLTLISGISFNYTFDSQLFFDTIDTGVSLACPSAMNQRKLLTKVFD